MTKYNIDDVVFIPADKLKGQIVRNGKTYNIQSVAGPSYYRAVQRNGYQLLITKLDEVGNELLNNPLQY